MQHKFRYGDLVIGNSEADDYYGITNTGTYWVVVDPAIYDDEDEDYPKEIGVVRKTMFERWHQYDNEPMPPGNREFPVYEKCFNFVKNIYQAPNKEHAPHVLEKFDD